VSPPEKLSGAHPNIVRGMQTLGTTIENKIDKKMILRIINTNCDIDDKTTMK